MKFIFINKDDTSFTEYNLRKVYFIPIIFLLVSLVTVPSIYFYLKYETANSSFSKDEKNMKEEYSKAINELEQNVSEYSDKIKKIENNLNKLHEKDDLIRDVIGLPLIPDDIRKMGTGGEGSSDDGSNIFENENIEQFVAVVDSLYRVSSLQDISYEKIDNYVENNLDQILRTPFIYPVDIITIFQS